MVGGRFSVMKEAFQGRGVFHGKGEGSVEDGI